MILKLDMTNIIQFLCRLLLMELFGHGTAQTISMHKTDNLPLFIYDKGYGRMQTNQHYYIHHFNLESFKIHVQDLKLKFKLLKENQFTSLILDSFDEIDSNLKNLLPFKRRKRWNQLGTVWKYLAGSPDANDLKIINSSINGLVSNNNEQVRINREISLQMKETLFKTKESIELLNEKSSELYSINIYLNLKFLNDKLEQILQTITLAKIGILNEKVLSQAEIDLLVRDLGRENLTVWNTAEALTYVTTSIVTNEHDIALLLKLPKLDPRIFRKIFVLPTWFNRQQIHIPNNNYLNHGDQYYIVSSLQPRIFDIKDITLDPTACVSNLLEGKPAKCDYLANPVEEVVSIDRQHLITNVLGNFTLHTNCGLSKRNLSGTYLISFNNCEVTINNQTFSNYNQNMTGAPIHLPLYGIPIEKQHVVVNLTLQHLHDLHLEARKEMEEIRLNANSIQWPHMTILGGLSFIPIVISMVFFLFVFRCRGSKVDIQVNQQEQITEPRKADQANQLRQTTDEVTSFQILPLSEIVRMEPHTEGGQVNDRTT